MLILYTLRYNRLPRKKLKTKNNLKYSLKKILNAIEHTVLRILV